MQVSGRRKQGRRLVRRVGAEAQALVRLGHVDGAAGVAHSKEDPMNRVSKTWATICLAYRPLPQRPSQLPDHAFDTGQHRTGWKDR